MAFVIIFIIILICAFVAGEVYLDYLQEKIEEDQQYVSEAYHSEIMKPNESFRGEVQIFPAPYNGEKIKPDTCKDNMVRIGRDAIHNDVVLKDEKLSRNHCIISYDADNNFYIIQDLSQNGVFTKEGVRLKKDGLNRLPRGTIIYLGNRDNYLKLL